MLAETLKSLRLKRRLTIQELAQHTDISIVMISRYETGKALPGPKVLDRLAKALGAEPDTLNDELIRSKTSVSEQTSPYLSKKTELNDVSYFEKFSELNEAQKKIVRAMIDELLISSRIKNIVNRNNAAPALAPAGEEQS